MSTRGLEGTEPESREDSPEGQEGSSEKRASKKRKVLSCYACRARKMKCDRVYPVCGRCKKNGRAGQCTYDPRLLEESHINSGSHVDDGGAPLAMSAHKVHDLADTHTASDELRWNVRLQERRIALLEQRLAANNSKKTPSYHEERGPEEPEFKEEMIFRGEGFKTQFQGATGVMSLISQYRELQAFTREALAVDHSVTRVKTDFKTFRGRRKMTANQEGVSFQGTDEEVMAILPERNVLDAQVALYFHTWETTYRILHEPSFRTEYIRFWELPREHRPIGFAVILLLIVATSKCLNQKDDVFVGDTTADRQAASDLIEICDSWIGRQPRKRMTLRLFQLHCLALLAKRANCVKLKHDWVTSGDLVRLALASGMHRDPSMLASGKITEFEKEMKRRLWFTLMELELQSSLESGLQSSLTSLYFDTPPPANLPDDAFSIDSSEILSSKPVEHFTSASYLVVAFRSLPFRINLAQILNDPSSDLQYRDILHYDAQIHSMISALPSWEEDLSVVPAALLQLQLRQYLLMLHKPYAKLVTKNQCYMYSFTTFVDVASSIVTTHNNLISKGILALNNFRNDMIRAGLSLSQVVYHNCTRYGPIQPSQPPPNNNETHFGDQLDESVNLSSTKGWRPGDLLLMLTSLPQEPFLARTLCASSLEILERARQLLEIKVMRLGTAYMEFWLLTAAVSMLPSVPSPATSVAYVTNISDDIHARCRITLDRFTTLTFRVLALQKDPANSFAVSLRTTMASVSPSDGRTPSMTLGASGGMAATPSAPNHAAFSAMPIMDTSNGVGDESEDLTGPFDALQDMQLDLGGWSFPDFWAFDLGADF